MHTSGGGDDNTIVNPWTPEESESLMMMMMDAHNDIVADADADLDNHYPTTDPLSVEELSSAQPAPPLPSTAADEAAADVLAADQQHGNNEVSDDRGGAVTVEEWEEVPAEVQRQWDEEANTLWRQQAGAAAAAEAAAAAVRTARTPAPGTEPTPTDVQSVNAGAPLVQPANRRQREKKAASSFLVPVDTALKL